MLSGPARSVRALTAPISSPQVHGRPKRSRLEQEAGGAGSGWAAWGSLGPARVKPCGLLLPGWRPAAFRERPEPLPGRRDPEGRR